MAREFDEQLRHADVFRLDGDESAAAVLKCRCAAFHALRGLSQLAGFRNRRDVADIDHDVHHASAAGVAFERGEMRHHLIEGHEPGAGCANELALAIDLVQNRHGLQTVLRSKQAHKGNVSCEVTPN